MNEIKRLAEIVGKYEYYKKKYREYKSLLKKKKDDNIYNCLDKNSSSEDVKEHADKGRKYIANMKKPKQ